MGLYIDGKRKDILTQAVADALYVLKTGDTMTGLLTLSGAPVNALHAATKAYVDAIGTSFPLLAPNGTFAAPSYSWSAETGLGFHRVAAATIALGSNAADVTMRLISSTAGGTGVISHYRSGVPGSETTRITMYQSQILLEVFLGAASIEMRGSDSGSSRKSLLIGGQSTGVPTQSFEESASATLRGFVANQFGAVAAQGARFHARRARGTEGTSTAVLSGDELGDYLVSGHDGTAYGVAAQILAKANQNWAVGAHGSNLGIYVVPDAATGLVETMRVLDNIVAVGDIDVAPVGVLVAMRQTSVSTIRAWCAGNQGQFVTRRSEGTFGTPTFISATSTLGEILFESYSESPTFSVGAKIEATATGTHSAGSVPSTLKGWTVSSGTTLVERFRIIGTDFHIGSGVAAGARLRLNTANGGGVNETYVFHAQTDVTAERFINIRFAETSGASPVFQGQKARGTIAAPAAVASGDSLVIFNSIAYTGADWATAGQYIISAAENWTGAAQGTSATLGLRKTGTTVFATRYEFLGSGRINLSDADGVNRLVMSTVGGLSIVIGGSIAAATPTDMLNLASEVLANNSVVQRYAAADVNAPTYVFRKSRGTLAVPVAVSSGDFLGFLQIQGYADAFQTAVQMYATAAETWSATVSGADFHLAVSRTGQDNLNTDRYTILGSGLHTFRSEAGASIVEILNDGKPNFQATPTQTTVGAAGAASALPANPTGYLRVQVAGAERVVPFYLQA